MRSGPPISPVARTTLAIVPDARFVIVDQGSVDQVLPGSPVDPRDSCG